MFRKKHWFLSVVLLTLQFLSVSAWGQEKNGLFSRLPLNPKMVQESRGGMTVITVVLQADQAGRLFPADPSKRAKAEFKTLVTDGKRAFLAVVSPGGQSSLTGNVPNLRVKNLEEIVSEHDQGRNRSRPELAGVPIIDKTLRLNPMTMDEGYINTLAYMELVNKFGLIPAAGMPLSGNFTKVVYRFGDNNNQWTTAVNPADGARIDAIPAGLHLVNFHPVKYLKSIETEDAEVLAVARSRYNILNTSERIRTIFGKAGAEDSDEIFSSLNVKDVKVAPFRVQIQWAKKTKAEKENPEAKKEPESLGLLKGLLVRAYSASKKFRGRELYEELDKVLDIQQLFRFMALNRILENGDISDEFFWYVLRGKNVQEARLGIMPQDGDDMFKGAHRFPFTPKQIALMVNSSALAKKLGLEYGYIMNFEDPLFRAVRDDAYLFYRYLEAFEDLAETLAKTGPLDRILGTISEKLAPYSGDPEVLARGLKDERKKAYSSSSFTESIERLKRRIRANAGKALDGIRTERGKPGDLDKVRKAVNADSSD